MNVKTGDTWSKHYVLRLQLKSQCLHYHKNVPLEFYYPGQQMHDIYIEIVPVDCWFSVTKR